MADPDPLAEYQEASNELYYADVIPKQDAPETKARYAARQVRADIAQLQASLLLLAVAMAELSEHRERMARYEAALLELRAKLEGK